MTGKFDHVAFSPGDVMRRLKDLEREVEELRAARRLEHSTIGVHGIRIRGGTLEALDNAGRVTFRVGRVITPIGTDGTGVQTFRTDGTPILESWTDPDNNGFQAIRDKSVNVIVSDDSVSGQGLARPYIGAFLSPTDSSLWPAATSAIFVDQWRGFILKQHPRLRVDVQVLFTDGATAGEVRVAVAGVAGAVQTVPAGAGATLTFFEDVAGGHLSSPLVSVQARRTAGTGLLLLAPLAAYGIQS